MQKPITLLKFDWLINDQSPELRIEEPDEGIPWTEYPFPEESGTGGFETIPLAMGMSFFHAKHYFRENVSDEFIPLAKVEVEYREPCLQAQSIKGGRVIYQENNSIIEIKPGQDLFRYTDKISIVPILDSSSDSEFYSFTVTESALQLFVGKETAEYLMKALGLEHLSTIKSHFMPYQVSKILQSCLEKPLPGELRNLYCQSKMLEYLTALIDYILKKPKDQKRSVSRIDESTIKKIHSDLVNLKGKIPDLNELASYYCLSARALNDSFKAIYGKSIFTVINNVRMERAHAAIMDTQTPLKVLAMNLGYSHVNHFNTAFKRRYGYSPGKLRV